MEKAREQERGPGHRPEILHLLGSGGMTEDEARELARGLVRRARREGGSHETEGTAPSPQEVRRRRETRRQRQA